MPPSMRLPQQSVNEIFNCIPKDDEAVLWAWLLVVKSWLRPARNLPFSSGVLNMNIGPGSEEKGRSSRSRPLGPLLGTPS